MLLRAIPQVCRFFYTPECRTHAKKTLSQNMFTVGPRPVEPGAGFCGASAAARFETDFRLRVGFNCPI
jgi:hypothetical protein